MLYLDDFSAVCWTNQCSFVIDANMIFLGQKPSKESGVAFSLHLTETFKLFKPWTMICKCSPKVEFFLSSHHNWQASRQAKVKSGQETKVHPSAHQLQCPSFSLQKNRTDGLGYQNWWIFGKVPNCLWPLTPLIFGKLCCNLFRKRPV